MTKINRSQATRLWISTVLMNRAGEEGVTAWKAGNCSTLLRSMVAEARQDFDRVVSKIDTRGDEILCSASGVKLYAKRQGCITRFWLGGYAPDGSDVRAALELCR